MFDLDKCIKDHNGEALFIEGRNTTPVRVKLKSKRLDLPNYYTVSIQEGQNKGHERNVFVNSLEMLSDRSEMPSHIVLVFAAGSLCHELAKPGQGYLSAQIYKPTDSRVAKHIEGLQPGQSRTVTEDRSGKIMASVLMLISTSDLVNAVALEKANASATTQPEPLNVTA